MTETEIRELFNRARMETSAKDAELTLALKDDGVWVLLFQSRGEELAIRVEEPSGATAESMKEAIRLALARLS